MEGLLPVIVKFIIAAGAAYYVYTDANKRNIRYANIWLIATFVFPLTLAGYLVYRTMKRSEPKLSKAQLMAVEQRKRAEKERKMIAEEKKKWLAMREEELTKNSETMTELRKIEQERLEEKERRLNELALERKRQEEEYREKLHLTKKKLEQ